jgi:HPt (histidine-containing phosphotransfer) domain-containing protein
MSNRKKRPPVPLPGKSVTVQPGAYPVFTSAVAMALLRAVRDPQVAAEAARVITDSANEMRGEVLKYIDRVEIAARAADFAGIYEHAHEIRGLAGNAGLAATARIANGLCRYLDAIARAQRKPETTVVSLHLEAISRAAHAEDEATRLGDAVADELAQLVEKKLAEINDSEIR